MPLHPHAHISNSLALAHFKALPRKARHAIPEPPHENEKAKTTTNKTGARVWSGEWKIRLHFVWANEKNSQLSALKTPKSSVFDHLYRSFVKNQITAREWDLKMDKTEQNKCKQILACLCFCTQSRVWVSVRGNKEMCTGREHEHSQNEWKRKFVWAFLMAITPTSNATANEVNLEDGVIFMQTFIVDAPNLPISRFRVSYGVQLQQSHCFERKC